MTPLPLMYYSVVCAWCKRLMALNGTTELRMHETVSHTVCETCEETLLAE